MHMNSDETHLWIKLLDASTDVVQRILEERVTVFPRCSNYLKESQSSPGAAIICTSFPGSDFVLLNTRFILFADVLCSIKKKSTQV